MSVGTKAGNWVGQALPRFEDEALLRGEGRFIDDLDPLPNVRHAAILRSFVPHARIAALDASAALELPGVVGVLTGADVAAMSRPFPAGIDSGVPYLAAAHEVTRYAGEPLAVVVARDRYVAEDAVELIQVEYDPLDACSTSRQRSTRRRASTTARSSTAMSTARSREPTSSCASASGFRAGAAHRWSATASSATGTSRRGR